MTDEKKPASSKPELKPGWYTYKANGASRWWDGSKWTDAVSKPDSPWSTIVGGFVVSVIGFFVAFSFVEDEPFLAMIGYVLAAVGSAGTLIGVIAEGVRQGARWAAYEKQQREGR